MDPSIISPIGWIVVAAIFAVFVIPLKFLLIVEDSGWRFSLRALFCFMLFETIAIGVTSWFVRVWLAVPDRYSRDVTSLVSAPTDLHPDTFLPPGGLI